MTSSGNTKGFQDFAREVRPEIDTALGQLGTLGSDCPDRLREAMLYSLLAPGKRLRPMLSILAAEACDGKRTDAMPAGCAVEMIHAYSLIHDDLPAMDDDDLRRGRPTCHKQFDEATAILAGDALLTLAFEMLVREIRPAGSAAECCKLLAIAAGGCGMVGGQADDIDAPGREPTPELLDAIHARKTGALIRCSLELGAVTADATSKQREALVEYGRLIGLTFQITDDLLDVRSDEATMGKRVGKDSELGKLTFPGMYGIEESVRRATQLTDRAVTCLDIFGNNADLLQELAVFILERNR